jgi:predicted nucleotidyltransferase
MNTTDLIIPTKEELSELLCPCPQIQAAALYGSVARGDSESHSDIDLLIVCATSQKHLTYDEVCANLIRRFDRLSIAIYTQQELLFLAKVRSLFLLHLSRESSLLFDRSGFLTQVLADFEPKMSYGRDFRQSLQLASPLCTIVSDSPNQYHRLAQTYSLFRVFGVYILANRGIFEFSKAKMTAALASSYPEQSQQIDLLSSLRIMNANFFTGGNWHLWRRADDHGKQLLCEAIQALGRLVDRPFTVSERSYGEAVQEFVCANRPKSRRLGYGLRTWFLLALYDGLNLYCQKHGMRILETFSEPALLELTDPDLPEAVRKAAQVGLDYLRNYTLKYFLLNERKISFDHACKALIDLSNV